jgi:hypothetical protein
VIERRFHRSFNVSEGARLHLSPEDGKVSISPWEREVLQVEVSYRAKVTDVGAAKIKDFEVEFSQDGSEIRVVGREPKVEGGGFFRLRELENRYTICAPSYLELDLRGEDGSVRIDDWRGRISIHMQDGGIDLRGIRSPSLKVRMEDGKLRMSGIRSPEIDIRAEDGSLELDLLRSDALDCRIHSDDAPVRVGLEKGSSLTFSISVDEGSVRVDHPEAAEVSRRRHRVTGRIGDGRGRLDITNADGAVLLQETSQ